MLTRQERARQFLPFDALTGLREALRKKEIEQEDKVLLSEESEEYLSDYLNELNIDDYIEVKYYNYSIKKYDFYRGRVEKIDNVRKKIIFEGEVKISISDIININRL